MPVITGTVYKRNGDPVIAKQTMEWFTMKANGVLVTASGPFDTASDGTYAVTLPAKMYWIHINGCTAIPGSHQVTNAPIPPPKDFKRSCGKNATCGSLRGKMLDKNGNDMSGHQDTTWQEAFRVDVKTNNKGRYNVTLPAKRTYAVSINNRPANPNSHAMASGSATKNFKMT